MINSDYIRGLIDGEGSFTVYIRDPKNTRKVKRRVTAEPKFYVKLIEKDRLILYELQKFFKCGKVYFQKDKRLNHQNCYRYEVFKREDLERVIIPFFKMHSLFFPSKKKDFNLFCELLHRMKSGEHLNPKKLKVLYAIKQKMHC